MGGEWGKWPSNEKLKIGQWKWPSSDSKFHRPVDVRIE